MRHKVFGTSSKVLKIIFLYLFKNKIKDNISANVLFPYSFRIENQGKKDSTRIEANNKIGMYFRTKSY